ncbi:hypothetical protein ACJ41O_008185 [Fusarium nematophilum]
MDAIPTPADYEKLGITQIVDMLNREHRPAINMSMLGLPSISTHSMSTMSDDNDNDDQSPIREITRPVILYSWTAWSPEEARKLAADFSAAMLDEENAFSLYSGLYSSVCGSAQPYRAARRFIAISCARTAGRPENVEQAQKLLLAQWSKGLANGANSYFDLLMLEAFMKEHQENADLADTRRSICDNIDRVLDNGKLVDLPHDYTAIDMVTYFFLSYGLDSHEQTSLNHPNASLTAGAEAILNEYVTRQPFINTLRCRGKSTLERSADWCSQQLRLGLDQALPLQDASIQPGETMRQWWDNIQVFCTLWGAMVQAVRAGNPPDWYVQCESAFGISASELLATLSWMIGDEHTRSNDVIAYGGGVLEHAAEGARALMELTPAELWVKFLNQFLWINDLVHPGEDDTAFESHVLHHLRRYVSDALSIQLPFPPEEPHMSAEPALDNMFDGLLGGYSQANFFDFSNQPLDYSTPMPPL